MSRESRKRTVHHEKSKEQLIEELTVLEESLDALPGSFVVYGADDRVKFRNQVHRQLFPQRDDEEVIGKTFHELMLFQARCGTIPEARGQEEAWADKQVEMRARSDEPFLQYFDDGRAFRVSLAHTPSGSFVTMRTEVTDMVEAERQLKQQETKFRTLAEIGNDWLWETDSDHRFISYTGYEAVGGLPETGRTGIRRWDHASERDLMDTEKWDRHKQQLENHEKFRNLEFEMDTNPPEWVRISGDPVFDDNGTFVGYRGTGSVITARVEAEKTTSQLITAFDSLKEMVAVVDADNRFVYSNQQFKKLNEPVAEFVQKGRHLEDYFRAVINRGLAPEAEGREDEYFNERMARLKNPGDPTEVHRTDGSWHLIREQRLPDGGQIMLGTDISDLKESQNALRRSEQRFREFAESTSDWIWEMDKELRYSYVSRRAAKVTGKLVEEMIGKTRKDVFGNMTTDDAWSKHYQTLVDRRSFRDFRYGYKTSDGRELVFSISGKPVFDDDGKFAGYRGTGTDITEATKRDEALKEALEEARQANQAKSEFLATMSHEFRTPLNAILGFSQMLQGQFLGPLGSKTYGEYADDIHYSGEHMLALVNDVLDIAAIEAGKRTFLPEPLAIEGLLLNCLRNIGKAADDKNIETSFNASDDLPYLNSDRRSVTQIFQNLLSNALKFTDPGGRIDLDVSLLNKAMVIVVSDTGIGIPADKLELVLEPFVQVETDPLLSRQGSGLGLSIVKSLVETLGGQMDIESEIGKGTSISVTLPLEHDLDTAPDK